MPNTTEEYCQEVGRAGRDGLSAMAYIYFNSYYTSKARENMTDTKRSYVQSDKCKREIILKYFGYDVPDKRPKDHTCCDFHRKICQCETYQLVQVADQVEALALDVQLLSHEPDDIKTVIIASEVKENIKRDIERYRVKLQREIGRSIVGSASLSSGLPVELIPWFFSTSQSSLQ